MIKKISTVVLIVISSVLFAQEKNEEITSYSLKQAQEYALQHNYNLINAGRDIEAAKKKVWETTAIGLPQVNAEVQFQNFEKLPTSVFPANSFNPTAPADELVAIQFGTTYNTTAILSATQLIFDGSFIVGLQAAKTYKELSINNENKTKAELNEAIAQAYYTAIGAIENQESLTISHQAAVTLLNETKVMLDVGLAEEQDVQQLQLNAASLNNGVNQATRQVLIAQNMLKFQMGMDLAESIQLTDDFESLVEMDENSSEFASQEFNFDQHFDFKLVQTNEELMKLNYKKEKFSFAPTLSAFFNHQQQNISNEFDAFSGGQIYPSTFWGLSLKLPLFTSGMRLSKMGQAKIEYEKSITNSEQTKQNLILQAQNNRSIYYMAYDTYITEKENLKLARSIYNNTIKKYGEGLSSSFELTQSQNQLQSIEGSYLRSIYDLLNAKAALKKALGSE